MQTELFTLKDVAALLDVAPHRITYLITSRPQSERDAAPNGKSDRPDF